MWAWNVGKIVLVHEVAAGVGEATSLRADMVHGKGEDAEPGASRGRYQTATRQDKTDEDSTGDASVAGSVGSVDVARQRVECGEGAAVDSVASVDMPSQRVECNRVDVGVECRQDVLVHEVAAGVGEATSLRADMVQAKEKTQNLGPRGGDTRLQPGKTRLTRTVLAMQA